MKKKYLLLSFIIILSIIILIIVRWHKAGRQEVVAERKKSDHLNISIIGDSYVEGGKLDTIISNFLLKRDKRAIIFSSGQGGANSRLIYENLFLDTSDRNSSNKVFHNGTKYCVVIAGVNDAAGQYGASFYSYHMILIIRALLNDNIKPVIVTLPEFGIQDMENNFSLYKKTRNEIFGYFTGNGFSNTINDYRKHFSLELIKQKLVDSVILVDYNNIITNYQANKSLFENPAHLNLAGRQKLGREIAKSILVNINRNHLQYQ